MGHIHRDWSSPCLFQYNKRLPAAISSAFHPILGDRIYGPIGKTIDVLSIFATVFGIATSLGLGAMQVTAGLHEIFGVPNELFVQLIVIAVATVLFIISINTGLEKGIQFLSNTAMILSFAIMLLILIVGPTVTIIKVFFNTTGLYISDFIHMSLRLKPFGEGNGLHPGHFFIGLGGLHGHHSSVCLLPESQKEEQ